LFGADVYPKKVCGSGVKRVLKAGDKNRQYQLSGYKTLTETQTNIITRINAFIAIVLCSQLNFFKVLVRSFVA
jgi:hypothetical protein